MLDHIGFVVADLARAQAFYDTALAPLGVGAIVTVTAEQSGGGAHVGYGSDDKAYFWLGAGETPLSGRLHVAFIAPDREAVDAFYAVAMNAGGRDNGPPGPRPHYHPDYYSAFVLDPDGHNIEAVCYVPG